MFTGGSTLANATRKSFCTGMQVGLETYTGLGRPNLTETTQPWPAVSHQCLRPTPLRTHLKKLAVLGTSAAGTVAGEKGLDVDIALVV
jgi:hypothetical protein